MKTFNDKAKLIRLGAFIYILTCFIGLTRLRADVIPVDRLPPAGRWDRNMVGVQGGIPNYTVIFANVKDAPYNAVGDGVSDDTQAIQAAVAACPNGQVVYIPEGTYLLKDQIYVLTKNFRSIVIRGAGPGKTKLLFSLTNSTNCITFNGDSLTAQRNVIAGYQRGSTQIQLDGDTPYQAGTVMYLFQGNGAGDMWLAAQGNAPDGCIHQSFNVVAADRTNHIYTVDRPVYYAGYTTDTSVSPYLQAGFADMFAEWCGIEDLYLENTAPKGGANIFFQGSRNCWVKNVESAKCSGWNIRFQYSRNCEVRQCLIHDGWNGGGDTMYGVGFYKMNCDNLVEDNIFYHCRHSMLTEYGNQGNVFGYNYSFDPMNEAQLGTDFLMGDMIAHGGLPMFTLYEGNVTARLSFDYELGGNRNLTAFRNWIQRQSLNVVNSKRAVDIARNGLYNNIVGNILLTAGQTVAAYDMNSTDTAYDGVRRYGFSTDGDINTANVDTRVSATTLYHMNWDFVYQGSVNYYDPSVSDTTLPNSYYYTSKPSWWPAGLAWPAIGPDLSNKTGGNPAYLRWQQMNTGTAHQRPSAPTGQKVNNP